MHDWNDAAGDPEYVWPGHDVYFCHKAHDAGIKIYCDLSLTSLHATTQWVGEKTFQSYRAVNPLPETEVINQCLT